MLNHDYYFPKFYYSGKRLVQKLDILWSFTSSFITVVGVRTAYLIMTITSQSFTTVVKDRCQNSISNGNYLIKLLESELHI